MISVPVVFAKTDDSSLFLAGSKTTGFETSQIVNESDRKVLCITTRPLPSACNPPLHRQESILEQVRLEPGQ